MLLTITYKGEKTQDLGYLLHKNPYRAQSFDLSFGNAYVFYPKVSDEETTAALLLDLNPIDLARGKLGSAEGGLFDYVNDRPYVASSFLSTALVRVFGTAMNGKCEKKPELVEQLLDLTVCVHMLPCRGNEEMPKEIFEPLGYTVETRQTELDEVFPEWGGSAYIDLTLHGNVTVAALLNHLYVLIPVFDRQKHYYVSEAEIEKLHDDKLDEVSGGQKYNIGNIPVPVHPYPDGPVLYVLTMGETTTLEKALIVGAILYTILPFSLIPYKAHKILGLLDEGLAVLYAVKKVQHKITPEINAKVDETLNAWFGTEEATPTAEPAE